MIENESTDHYFFIKAVKAQQKHNLRTKQPEAPSHNLYQTVTMKSSKRALLFCILGTTASLASCCPFAKNNGGDASNSPSLPDDEIHRRSLRRRLSDTPESQDKVKAIIDNRAKEQQRLRLVVRSLAVSIEYNIVFDICARYNK